PLRGPSLPDSCRTCRSVGRARRWQAAACTPAAAASDTPCTLPWRDRVGRSNVASSLPLRISILATCPLPKSATQRFPASSRDMRRGPVPSLKGSRFLTFLVRVSTQPTEPFTCEYHAHDPS